VVLRVQDEIHNSCEEPRRTVNIYVPPAYTDEENEQPPGRA
jgi:hypothetical protein